MVHKENSLRHDENGSECAPRLQILGAHKGTEEDRDLFTERDISRTVVRVHSTPFRSPVFGQQIPNSSHIQTYSPFLSSLATYDYGYDKSQGNVPDQSHCPCWFETEKTAREPCALASCPLIIKPWRPNKTRRNMSNLHLIPEGSIEDVFLGSHRPPKHPSTHSLTYWSSLACLLAGSAPMPSSSVIVQLNDVNNVIVIAPFAWRLIVNELSVFLHQSPNRALRQLTAASWMHYVHIALQNQITDDGGDGKGEIWGSSWMSAYETKKKYGFLSGLDCCGEGTFPRCFRGPRWLLPEIRPDLDHW